MAHSNMPGQLQNYWLHGAGASKIKWGVAGDFERCVVAIQAEVTDHGGPPLDPKVIRGLCATLHKKATGATPGHAPGEKK